MTSANEISARAWYALDDHKSTCPRCGDPSRQMCETGRGLQNHLWDCQRAASATYTATIQKRH